MIFYFKELYLQENKIKKLPEEITQLKCLVILNLAKNCLKVLPDTMGQLKNLSYLNISFNKDLNKLPKSLGYAQQIQDLQFEGLKLSYPPLDILTGGTILIIAFLANECGINYSPENCKTEEINHLNLHNTRKLDYNEDDNIKV